MNADEAERRGSGAARGIVISLGILAVFVVIVWLVIRAL
jgi:hypothetical protein